VHGDRGNKVQEWLTATGNPEPSPKNYCWSHMAGWYAKNGCEDFFRQVWREEPVREQLQPLLTECGMNELVAALESGPEQEPPPG
jgi:hypothetical protein